MYPFARGKLIDPRAFHELASDLGLERGLLGQSTQERDIYSYHWGNGKTKLLIWSQMHGNEPSGTFALWRLMNRLQSGEFDELKGQLQIRMIPILNPDGTLKFSRLNAIGIDLNRDARSRSTPEIKALFKELWDWKADWAFNLHDQRNIFNVSGTSKPASIALLAPSVDESRKVTDTRKDVMKLVADCLPALEDHIPGHIARFTDEFYPRASGDVIQSLGVRCLLIESGAYPNDPLKEKPVEMNELLMVKALHSIASGSYKNADIRDYKNIPENDKKLVDLLIRNVVHKGTVCDIGFLYKEELKRNELRSKLLVTEVGDLSDHFGYREEDLRGEVLAGSFIPGKEPKSEHPLFDELLRYG